MELKFADLHAHSTLRPFANSFAKLKKNKAYVWYKEGDPQNPSGRAKNYTQSDFKSLTMGGAKLVFSAAYAIEQGWFDLLEALGLSQEDDLNKLWDFYSEGKKISSHPLIKKVSKIVENSDNKEKIITDLIAVIGHWVTSLPVKRILEIMTDNYNYFEAITAELDFLIDQCKYNKKHYNSYLAKIPANNEELEKFLLEKNTLIVIPSIEGASAFVNGNTNTIEDFLTSQANRAKFTGDIHKNIQKIKDNYPVFFVTLSHHFYTGFNGHSQSIYGTGRIGIDQMLGKGNVITTFGWKVVKHLLSIEEYTNTGKRILIDTKHLSIPARIEYYKFIEKYNSENPTDKIPIISSHSAFSGIKKIENIGLKNGSYSNYEVNIATEEVIAINNSKGLIGLNFDQNVLSELPHEDDHDHEGGKTKDWTPEQWAQLFVDNILGMVSSAIKIKNNINEKIWDIFTIGSDFDGFINPVNAFATGDKLPLLHITLIKILNNNDLFKELSFGLSAETVVNKFMGENAINFARKNYWKKTSDLIS